MKKSKIYDAKSYLINKIKHSKNVQTMYYTTEDPLCVQTCLVLVLL